MQLINAELVDLIAGHGLDLRRVQGGHLGSRQPGQLIAGEVTHSRRADHLDLSAVEPTQTACLKSVDLRRAQGSYFIGGQTADLRARELAHLLGGECFDLSRCEGLDLRGGQVDDLIA